MTSSRFLGVSFDRGTARWAALLTVDGETVHLGRFNTEREAAVARDRVALHLRGDLAVLNFPNDGLRPLSVEELKASRRRKAYPGVSLRKGRFAAVVRGQRCGTWTTQREAAIAVDRARLHFGMTSMPLPFADEARALGPASPAELIREAALKDKRATDGGTSRYVGVYWCARDGAWKASICIDGRSRHVGRFDTQREAAVARDRVAAQFLGNKTVLNFPDAAAEPATIDAVRPRRVRERVRRASDAEGLVGVSRRQNSGPGIWVAVAKIGGQEHRFGAWETPEEAAIARDRGLLHYVGNDAKLNFPEEARRLGPADGRTLRALSRQKYKETTTSRFRGVWWAERQGAWLARLNVGGRLYHLGTFDSELRAAHAYDRVARRVLGAKARLNFHPRTGVELFGQMIRDVPIGARGRASGSNLRA